ncbi:hypothetical protein K1719_003403 [Acacia pycnantha]|nr:hypothetical protein K1719_003403 [Acacia pycnantha]
MRLFNKFGSDLVVVIYTSRDSSSPSSVGRRILVTVVPARVSCPGELRKLVLLELNRVLASFFWGKSLLCTVKSYRSASTIFFVVSL